jgi:hypothetical protein
MINYKKEQKLKSGDHSFDSYPTSSSQILPEENIQLMQLNSYITELISIMQYCSNGIGENQTMINLLFSLTSSIKL